MYSFDLGQGDKPKARMINPGDREHVVAMQHALCTGMHRHAMY